MPPVKTFAEIFPESGSPVLLATPANICYTTGFYTTARRPAQIGYTCALLTPRQTLLFCPAAWADTARISLEGTDIEVCAYSGGAQELAEALRAHLKSRATVGLDMTGTELEFYMELCRALPGVRWQDVTRQMQMARLIKTPAELDALRKSAAVAAKAMEYARTILRPGKTERQIAAELEYEMRRHGSDGTPFTMKVLCGEHAVRTINIPDDTVLRGGEIVLLDFGATVDHYTSDWTRSFALCSASPEQEELYRLVWEVERACIRAACPGTPVSKLMRVAEQTMAGHPYAAGFNPYLGHSIGLASQEWPPLRRDTELILQENMVLTIEPGIYLPGLGGVRIEDEIVITGEGAVCLTGLHPEGFVVGN